MITYDPVARFMLALLAHVGILEMVFCLNIRPKRFVWMTITECM